MSSYSRRFFCFFTATWIGLITGIPTALAEERKLTHTLDANRSTTFSFLVQQAESFARNAIAQEFARNSNVTEVSITVLGDRNGQISPILTTVMSRDEWQQAGGSLAQTNHFFSSRTLLGFLNPNQASETDQSGTPPFPLPSPTPFEDLQELENDPGFRDD